MAMIYFLWSDACFRSWWITWQQLNDHQRTFIGHVLFGLMIIAMMLMLHILIASCPKDKCFLIRELVWFTIALAVILMLMRPVWMSWHG